MSFHGIIVNCVVVRRYSFVHFANVQSHALHQIFLPATRGIEVCQQLRTSKFLRWPKCHIRAYIYSTMSWISPGAPTSLSWLLITHTSSSARMFSHPIPTTQTSSHMSLEDLSRNYPRHCIVVAISKYGQLSFRLHQATCQYCGHSSSCY